MNYYNYTQYFERIISLLESVVDSLSFIQANGRYILYSIILILFIFSGFNLLKKRWLDL